MKEAKCRDCKHFRQHYVHFCETRYDPINCGHCVYPRLKHRQPKTTACIHFAKKPDTQAETSGH